MNPADVTRVNRALNKLSKLYRAAKAHALAELDLHPGQDVLLWVLSQAEDGMTISALADRLGVESPTATRSLKRMEHTGLFRRDPVPSDRRQVRITLTPQGRALIPRIEQVWADLAGITLGPLSDEDQATVVRALEQANEELRGFVGGDHARAVLADD